MENKNPIFLAKEKASLEKVRLFTLKPDEEGYSHYRTMMKPNAKPWKAQAWLVERCVNFLGMKYEDFHAPAKKEIANTFNLTRK